MRGYRAVDWDKEGMTGREDAGVIQIEANKKSETNSRGFGFFQIWMTNQKIPS
jgi:hypothetical protein